MDALTFHSFVRTAMELQADLETPGDYTMVKAAVEAKYGITKESASEEWIRKMVASGARKDLTGRRVAKFVDNRLAAYGKAVDSEAHIPRHLGFTPHTEHVIHSNSVAAREGQRELDFRTRQNKIKMNDRGPLPHINDSPIWGSGVVKKAWNTGELAGLGVLAAPSASSLAGHPWGEKAKDVSEVAGLGMLAAPYAHNIAAAKSARYANSGIGKRLARAFSH